MKHLKLSMMILFAAGLLTACLENPYPPTIWNGGTGGGGGGIGGGGDTGGGGGTGTGSAAWQAITKGEHGITETNKGFDILVAMAPASKIEMDRTPTSVRLSSTGVTNVNSEEPELAAIDYESFYYSKPQSYYDFNQKLRDMENDFLMTGARQLDSTHNASKMLKYDETTDYTFFEHLAETSTYTTKYVGEDEYAVYFVETKSVATIKPLIPQYTTGFKGIYETLTTKFGPTGDVDNNGKVSIVFYTMPPGEENTLGYFMSGDKYPKTIYERSNEADVFYVNATKGTNVRVVLETASHELQHMTFFHNKYINNLVSSTDTWINEGLSMLSSFMTGYGDAGSNNNGWIGSFLKRDYPTLSLTAWTQINYGFGAVFTYYLKDRFGDDIASKIYGSALTGIAAVEYAVSGASSGAVTDFNVLFNDFAQALYLSNTGISTDPKFNFKSINMKDFVSAGTRPGLAYSSAPVNVGASKTLSILPYSLSLNKINGDVRKIAVDNLNGVYPYGAIYK